MQSGAAPDSLLRVTPDVAACAARLRAGEILLAPTESFVGLIAMATHAGAVAQILTAKGDARIGKAMPLLVADVAAAWEAAILPPWAVALASLWPAPLTLALPARRELPGGVAAADGTIGVRVPDDAWLCTLAQAVNAPLTATSANASGAPAVTALDAVMLCDWRRIVAVDRGASRTVAAPRASTVVTQGEGDDDVHLVREGPVARSVIEQTLARARVPASNDKVYNAQAIFAQPERNAGYRFNLDSLLLVDFVRPHRAGLCVDLGAGVGIIGQLLLLANKASSLVSVERQLALAHLCARNASANGLAARARVYPVDLREMPAMQADMVVFNPPYFRAQAGRPNHCVGKDEARRECHGTLADFVRQAASVLKPQGRMFAIVPYARRDELQQACRNEHLVPVRTQAVLAFADNPPRHFLLEAQSAIVSSAAREMPWIIHHADGTYREDVAALTRGHGRTFP